MYKNSQLALSLVTRRHLGSIKMIRIIAGYDRNANCL